MINRRNLMNIILQTAIASGAISVFGTKLRAQTTGLLLLIPKMAGIKPFIDYFSSNYGIILTIHTYNNNDELLRAIIGKKIKYDIVIMSGSEIPQFIKHNYIAPLNYRFLKNLDNLDPKNIRNAFDEKLKFTIPLFTYHLGLLTNQKNNIINDWDNILTKILPRADGAQMRVNWVNDGATMFRIALLHLNYNLLDPTLDEIKDAKKFLLTQKKNIYGISELFGDYDIINKNTDLMVSSANDAMAAQKSDSSIEFITPNDGLIRDDFVVFILASSENIALSHAFIDLLILPVVAKYLSEHYSMQTTNKEALKIINPNILNNTAIYPKKSKIYQARPFIETTATEIHNAWSEIYG